MGEERSLLDDLITILPLFSKKKVFYVEEGYETEVNVPNDAIVTVMFGGLVAHLYRNA